MVSSSNVQVKAPYKVLNVVYPFLDDVAIYAKEDQQVLTKTIMRTNDMKTCKVFLYKKSSRVDQNFSDSLFSLKGRHDFCSQMD